jgi:ABC-type antimicrobial peptide transport system permease subunit
MNHKKELKKYIKRSRKLGFSIKEITDSLLATGWSQEEIRDGFELLGKNSFLKIPMVFLNFVLNIFLELGKILKGDIFIFKKASSKIKREIEKESEEIEKETFFIFDKLNLLWHYFVRFFENIFMFFENIFSPFIKILYLPFLVFGFSSPKKSKILKNIPIGPLSLREENYDFAKISKSSGKISFFDAFWLARRVFEIKRLRVFLILFGLSLGFSIFLFLGYFLLGFDAVLLEKISTNIQVYGGLHEVALSDTLEQAKRLLYLGSVGLAIFGVLVLLFFVLGLVNVIKLILLERKKEIEIMMIAGASKRDIFRLFFAESMIMGVFGGAGGVISAYFTAFFINYGIIAIQNIYPGLSLNLFLHPVWFIDSVFVFSVLLGLVIGFWPKNRLNINNIIKKNNK